MRKFGFWGKPFAIAVLSLFTVSGNASAFYFPNWPGAQIPQPKTLLNPHVPQDGNPPSVHTTIYPQPPVTSAPPVTITSTEPPPSTPPVQTTPEPATILGSMMGLSAIGLYARLRRKGK